MFRWIRNFREALRRRRGSVISARWREVFECEHGPLPASKGPGAYQRNMEFFRSVCEPSHDMVFRELICCGQRAALIFADGANNKQLLEQDVVAPLLTASGEMFEGDLPSKGRTLVKEFILHYKKNLISMWETQEFEALPPLELTRSEFACRIKSNL